MSDPIVAHTITLGNCDKDCPCQSVHILLLHDDGASFATIGLSSDDARMLAIDLGGAADIADAQKAKVEGRVQ